MSSRNVSVKSIKHNNNINANFVASSKPNLSVSKTQKNHHQQQQHHTSIQQPKKNHQKLQATQKKHGRNNNKTHNNKKVVVSEDDSSSTSSSSSEEESPRQQNNKTMRKKHQQQQQFEYKSFVDQVYAGPTFNNAPLPSALPIPAFNARGSPINYPQPLYHSVNPSLQQQSMDLMNLLTPQKVVTAYELEKTNLALSEIQRGLRSMLKIES